MTQTENHTNAPGKAGSLQDRLIAFIASVIEPLGYEVVFLEITTARQKTVRLFIDYLTADGAPKEAIGIEDCVKVTKALDEPLDQFTDSEGILKGTYELEVSSPGVDRPLRLERDYQRFAGREARIHIFRPLSAQEIANAEYLAKNPKQKNFVGTLQGVQDGKVILAVSPDGGSASSKKGAKASKSNGRNKKKGSETPEAGAKPGLVISIPLPLISKANLEPEFDFESNENVVEI